MLFTAALMLQSCDSGGRTKVSFDSDPDVGVVKVTRKDLSDTLQIASEFLPFQEVNVYAKVSGYIHKLYVDWGTRVHAGQLLAELEIPKLQQQLELDQAAVHRAEHDLARTKEEVNDRAVPSCPRVWNVTLKRDCLRELAPRLVQSSLKRTRINLKRAVGPS